MKKDETREEYLARRRAYYNANKWKWQKYAQEHRAQVNEGQRRRSKLPHVKRQKERWNKENAEKIKAYKKKWEETHSEYHKRYYESHKPQFFARNKEYDKRHPLVTLYAI